jgi:hypothetical protein
MTVVAVDSVADDTEEDRDIDGVLLSCCNRRSNGEERRAGSRPPSGVFRLRIEVWVWEATPWALNIISHVHCSHCDGLLYFSLTSR